MPSHTHSRRRNLRSASQGRLIEQRSHRRAAQRPLQWEYDSRSAADTARLGQTLGRSLRGGEMLALYGDLGTGKTALVRGIATGLNAPPRAVSSPTFVLVHLYTGRLRLAHADLYRIEHAIELRHLGLEEYDDDRTVVVVEWAEKAQAELPSDRLDVHLEHVSRTRRRLHLRPTGSQSERLLKRAMATHMGQRR